MATQLSQEQLLAVQHPLGSAAIVVAGAGSGKTTLLTARLRYLLDQGVRDRAICVITFTNKAADELRRRLGLSNDPKVGPRVSTIHSLALNAIRMNPEGFGLKPRLSTLDSSDQKDLIRRMVEGRKKDPRVEDINIYRIVEKIEYHRARGVGFTDDYTPEVHKAAQLAYKGYHALSEIELLLWKDYEKAKQEASVVDFSDMLHLVVRRGKTDERWRTGVQKQFVTTLVDESQDTNSVQWEFIELLLHPDNRNLFAVGDLSQSIYGFNGAAPEILGGMVENWRGARPALYKLEDNYRSLEKIVRFSNKIQSTMTGTVPLTMKWKRTAEHTGRVTTIRAATSREIAERIAENIYRDHVNKTGEFKFKDNAILVRSASQISDIETALVRQRIPYVIRGGQGLFQTEEARDLFAYMKLIVNPHDVVAFLRAVGTPSRGIGPMATDKLQREAIAKHGGDMVAAAAASEHMKLRPFGEFLANLREVQDPVLILNKVIKYIDYPGIIRDSYKKKPEVVETKLANLTRIQDAIQGLQANDPSASPADIIFRITLDQKAEAEKEAGAVVISTIHSAKGLEWPRVFVTNLVEGSLPHQWSQTDKEVEEERRLFYVAVTRAEVALSLCIPSMVFRGPNAQSVSPSRFLAELGL